LNEFSINIAVSGHRQLDEKPDLEQAVINAGNRIRWLFSGQRFQVYSCLAEGADRMLARILVATLPADLVAVLPLPERDYRRDFSSGESLHEFQQFKKAAASVVVLGKNKKRPQAYHAANQYLLQNCQVLVAVWDGLPARGEGGTAELVEAVRQTGRMLLWIPANAQHEGITCIEENFPPAVTD